MPNPYEEPVKIEGVLWQNHMRTRIDHGPGYITVLLKIPAESADDAYEAFNWIGIKPTPFKLVLGREHENN